MSNRKKSAGKLDSAIFETAGKIIEAKVAKLEERLLRLEEEVKDIEFRLYRARVSDD